MTDHRDTHWRLSKRVLLASVAAATLGCASTIALPESVSGSISVRAEAKTVFGNTDDLDISVIDANRLVDITFTLTGDNPYDDVDPEELPPAPLNGYQITVTQILGFDPRDPVDRLRADAITPEGARLLPHGVTASAVTDEHGFAKISDLPIGLYLVETVAPQGDPTHKYKKLEPFLVMLPTGGIEGWDYVPILSLKETPDDPPVIPTFPSSPSQPSQPPAPGEPEQPGGPDKGIPHNDLPGVLKRLPMTGAQVIATFVASLCFIAAGAVFLFFGIRRRQSNQDR